MRSQEFSERTFKNENGAPSCATASATGSRSRFVLRNVAATTAHMAGNEVGTAPALTRSIMSTTFAVSSRIADEPTDDGSGLHIGSHRIASLAIVGGLVAGGWAMGATAPALEQLQTALPTMDIRPLTQISAPVVPARKSAKAPARNFELSTSTRKQVRAWATELGLHCKMSARGRLSHCDEGSGHGATHMTFRFNAAGKLISLDRLRRGMDLAAAQARFEDVTYKLDGTVGEATAVVGKGRGFVTAAYERSVRDYDYSGYRATVTATHFGANGIQLRERYSVSR
jgi:hypothetical protein